MNRLSIASRSVFAAAAVVITMSIGGFIDYLANSYAPHPTVQAAATRAVALAPLVDWQ